jgi:hypothetical protein
MAYPRMCACIKLLLPFLSLTLSALLLMAQVAAAKPKQQTYNGCTVEQIQSPRAQSCLDQMQADVTAGHAYPHTLYCDETGMYCCQCCIENSAGTGNFACKAVRTASPVTRFPRPTIGPAEPGSASPPSKVPVLPPSQLKR